jgi:hypothetical protein
MIKCPYDALTLQIAMLGAANKLDAFEKKNGEGSTLQRLESLNLSTPPAGELNKQAAAHHGITVEQLINSPNYATLKTEYAEHMVERVMTALKSEFGFEDKEAWALMMHDKLGNL